VADLDHLFDLERQTGVRFGVAHGHLPQVVIDALEVLAGRDVPQVVIVLVGAADHVDPTLQALVGEQGQARHAHRPERAGVGAEPRVDFLGMRRTKLLAAGRALKLRLAELVIAAQQGHVGLAVADTTRVLINAVAGTPRNAATSSMVFWFGV